MADNASIVIDFTGGSPDDLATAANLLAGTHNASGISASWTLSRTSQHTFIRSSTALPLLEPVICGGTTYTDTSGRALEYDLDLAAVQSWEKQTMAYGAAGVNDMSIGAMTTLAVDVGNNNDMFIILDFSGHYGVTQYREEPPSSGHMGFNTHGQVSASTSRGPLIETGLATPYWITQRRNYSEGTVELVIQNGSTGAFIGCSRCPTDTSPIVTGMDIGTYLDPVGGSFKHSFIAIGIEALAALPLCPGTFVLPPPASVVATDNTTDITLDFGGDAAITLAFGYRIERTDDYGATWDEIESNLEVVDQSSVVSPYTDATATGDDIAYQYRITALLGAYESVPTESNVITRGDPPGAVEITGSPIY